MVLSQLSKCCWVARECEAPTAYTINSGPQTRSLSGINLQIKLSFSLVPIWNATYWLTLTYNSFSSTWVILVSSQWKLYTVTSVHYLTQPHPLHWEGGRKWFQHWKFLIQVYISCSDTYSNTLFLFYFFEHLMKNPFCFLLTKYVKLHKQPYLNIFCLKLTKNMIRSQTEQF